MALGKPTDLAAVAVGQTYQYKVNFYNAGQTTLTSVVVRDTLPGGVQFISAVPPRTAGPNPLTWNLGTLQPGQKFEALVTVKATSNGPLEKLHRSDQCAQLPAQTVCETIPGRPGRHSESAEERDARRPSHPAAPYVTRWMSTNVGTATSGNPVVIRDVLPGGLHLCGGACADRDRERRERDAQRQRRRSRAIPSSPSPRASRRARRWSWNSAPR